MPCPSARTRGSSAREHTCGPTSESRGGMPRAAGEPIPTGPTGSARPPRRSPALCARARRERHRCVLAGGPVRRRVSLPSQKSRPSPRHGGSPRRRALRQRWRPVAGHVPAGPRRASVDCGGRPRKRPGARRWRRGWLGGRGTLRRAVISTSTVADSAFEYSPWAECRPSPVDPVHRSGGDGDQAFLNPPGARRPRGTPGCARAERSP